MRMYISAALTQTKMSQANTCMEKPLYSHFCLPFFNRVPLLNHLPFFYTFHSLSDSPFTFILQNLPFPSPVSPPRAFLYRLFSHSYQNSFCRLSKPGSAVWPSGIQTANLLPPSWGIKRPTSRSRAQVIATAALVHGFVIKYLPSTLYIKTVLLS